MTDIQNTQVMHVPLTLTVTDAATGVVTVVPVPTGDVFSAVSTGTASLGAAIAPDANGNQELVLTPLVIESDAGNAGGGFSVTVTDSGGDIQATGGPYNIVTVPVVDSIALGTPTFTAQAAPTAAGP